MENIKEIVRSKYDQIAKQSRKKETSCCCGCGTSDTELENIFIGEEYKQVDGHFEDADLGLGCGIPTQHAEIKPGDSVLDLGAGAGNDCFVVRSIVGETGHVIGLDFSDEMFEQARKNAGTLGYDNVEFIKGDIEEIPLYDDQFDVIISNCVLNLVPDKQKAFSEIYRVMKPGGHFCISDVIIKGELPEKFREDAVLYAGCVAGAVSKEKYLEIVTEAGFSDISFKKEKEVALPDEILLSYFTAEEIASLRESGVGIYSATVVASK